MASASHLIVGVGDIHGRFHRVETWLESLEAALRRQVEAVFAVGDVEAFRKADDHRRKAAKRAMPAEFAGYAEGLRTFLRPLYFIGGNNEDFETLHPMMDGGDLAPNVHYLGRVGMREMLGLRVGFLSGIHAPRFVGQALLAPHSPDTSKQAGYFRMPEVEKAAALEDVDLMLLHEWPRGLIAHAAPTPPPRPLPSPWIGNPLTRRVVDAVRPRWIFCGHSHRAFAVTLPGPDGETTRVACLDEAARSDPALFWMEYQGREALRAGWGVSGQVAWTRGEAWTLASLPPD